jgi:hypothetical protein
MVQSTASHRNFRIATGIATWQIHVDIDSFVAFWTSLDCWRRHFLPFVLHKYRHFCGYPTTARSLTMAICADRRVDRVYVQGQILGRSVRLIVSKFSRCRAFRSLPTSDESTPTALDLSRHYGGLSTSIRFQNFYGIGIDPAWCDQRCLCAKSS